jgi:hypothetical protein
VDREDEARRAKVRTLHAEVEAERRSRRATEAERDAARASVDELRLRLKQAEGPAPEAPPRRLTLLVVSVIAVGFGGGLAWQLYRTSGETARTAETVAQLQEAQLRATRAEGDARTLRKVLDREGLALRQARADIAALRRQLVASRGRLGRASLPLPELYDGKPRTRGRVPKTPRRTIRVSGGILSRGVVQKVVEARLGAIQRCYEVQLLKHPTLAGKIVFDFVISPMGRVVSGVQVRSSMRSPNVASCVLLHMRSWTFPRPVGGAVKVRYPLVFRLQRRR